MRNNLQLAPAAYAGHTQESTTAKTLVLNSLFEEPGSQPVFFVHPECEMRFGSPSEVGLARIASSLSLSESDINAQALYPARYHTVFKDGREVGLVAGRSMLSLNRSALVISFHVDLVHVLDDCWSDDLMRELGRGFVGQAQQLIDEERILSLSEVGHRVEVNITFRGEREVCDAFVAGCRDSLFGIEETVMDEGLDYQSFMKRGVTHPAGIWA